MDAMDMGPELRRLLGPLRVLAPLGWALAVLVGLGTALLGADIVFALTGDLGWWRALFGPIELVGGLLMLAAVVWRFTSWRPADVRDLEEQDLEEQDLEEQDPDAAGAAEDRAPRVL